MRALLLALAVSGCGFSIATNGAEGDDQPGPDVDAGSATTPPRSCTTTDPSLRLCIDFDDTTNLASDASAFAHPVDGENLVPMQRAKEGAVEGAVQLEADSYLWVAETADLDIPDALTVSMWIKADVGILPLSATSGRWLFDNNTQYYASVRFAGQIRCGSGTVTVTSPPIIADGRWYHVACTYEEEELRVYLDGDVAACEETSERSLPTGGEVGLAIGANVAGGGPGGGPKFTEQFVGGIDNVQVFARELSASEVCAAAGKGACESACPDS